MTATGLMKKTEQSSDSLWWSLYLTLVTIQKHPEVLLNTSLESQVIKLFLNALLNNTNLKLKNYSYNLTCSLVHLQL